MAEVVLGISENCNIGPCGFIVTKTNGHLVICEPKTNLQVHHFNKSHPRPKHLIPSPYTLHVLMIKTYPPLDWSNHKQITFPISFTLPPSMISRDLQPYKQPSPSFHHSQTQPPIPLSPSSQSYTYHCHVINPPSPHMGAKTD